MMSHRILVIEDNADTRELVSFLLSKAGYIVMAAQDGRAGRALAISEIPDAVVLDLGMPVIDGWELARLLKSNPDTQAIRIVALTGRVTPADRMRALDAGCDAYLTKPLDLDLLLTTMRDLLETPVQAGGE
jgi:CheY-like chemotaxis protein